MVAKYERATLVRSPDSPHEGKLLLFTIMIFDISFVRADANVVSNAAD